MSTGREGKHPKQCETAVREECKCGACGGTKHQWLFYLGLARNKNYLALEGIREGALREWEEQYRKQRERKGKRRKPNVAHEKSTTDLVQVDIIESLARGADRGGDGSNATAARHGVHVPAGTSPHHARAGAGSRGIDHATEGQSATEVVPEAERSSLDSVQEVGELVVSVLEDVEREQGKLSRDTRIAMADHLWCELLVQLALAFKESEKRVDNAIDRVTDRIVFSRESNSHTVIDRALVRSVVKHTWGRLAELGSGAVIPAGVVTPALRVLALLICKRPSRHRSVIEHCVVPLQRWLREKTWAFVRHVFGPWLPTEHAESAA